mmetsp:Transcript_15259/g.44109  ORF Transcript_15259/g.44109 Transcript_15259/m.44109 type:complete len:222 (-) Transcript_15259:1053-1718(-)
MQLCLFSPPPPPLLIEPKRIGCLHLRSEPRSGSGHGPPRRVVGNPLRQELRYLYLAQEPYSGVVLALVVRVALRMPNTLGRLEHQIGTGGVQRKDHVVPIGMGRVLVDGRNLETKFRQCEGRSSGAGDAVRKSCHGPILKAHGLLGAVVAGEMRVGVHRHLPDRRDGFGIRLEVQEAFPHHVRRCLDVQHHEARTLPSHIVLKLDSFAHVELPLLVVGKLR